MILTHKVSFPAHPQFFYPFESSGFGFRRAPIRSKVVSLVGLDAPWTWILLVLAGVLAGFIDSIAGGGGLINLPMLVLILGPGALPIGTNKIAGATAAFVALLVYLRAGHVQWGRSFSFALWVSLGSLGGSQISPLLPQDVFYWLLAITCPVILWIVWRKEIWVARELSHSRPQAEGWRNFIDWPILGSGLLCGIYDGAWGPGGGAFMFLSLLFVARLPILASLAAAKFANLGSALASLGGYWANGYVNWIVGLTVAAGVVTGAYFGATHATKNAARAVRPILAIVALLLLAKLLLEK